MFTVFNKALGILTTMDDGNEKFLVENQRCLTTDEAIGGTDRGFVVNKVHFDIKFKVTLHYCNDIDEDSIIEPVAGQTYKMLVNPPNAKVGYLFDGWYTNSAYTGDPIVASSTVLQEITDLYAKWIYCDFSNCTTFNVVATSANREVNIATLTKNGTAYWVLIDWGDGVIEGSNESMANASHTYSANGTYVVKIADTVSNIVISNSARTTPNAFAGYVQLSTTMAAKTSFASYEFKYCTGITNLSFIDLFTKVTAIPSYCFSYCTGMTNLMGLPARIKTFNTYACQYSGLTSLTGLHSNITSLGNYCFDHCTSLVDLSALSSTISIGTYCFQYCTALTNLSTLPARATLPNYCFYYCSGLTSVALGSTYTSIGTYCFRYCSNLVTVDLSETKIVSMSTYCFANCSKLQTALLPSTFTGTIGTYAFYYNYALTDIVIPEGTTSLGNYAFQYCYNLKNITIPESVATIGTYCFSGCRALQTIMCNSLTAPTVSGTNAFGTGTGQNQNQYTGYTTRTSGTNSLVVKYDATGYTTGAWADPLCNSLKCGFTLISGSLPIFTYTKSNNEITITGLTTSGAALTDIEIPETIENCPVVATAANAFLNKTNIESVTLPEGFKTIGATSFSGCSNLATVSIPSTLETIESSAFNNCTSLRETHINNLTSWLNINFANANASPLNWSEHLYLNGSEVTNLIIPNSITEIKTFALYGCVGITSITFHSNLTSIGNSAFGYCTGITSVILPEGLTSMGTSAFIRCSGITTLSIPSTLTSTGSGSFNNCTSLVNITLHEGLTQLAAGTFGNCTSLPTIEIPSTVTNIGATVFTSCVNLTSITCKAVTAPTVASTTFGSTASNYTGLNTASSGANTLYIPTGATGYDSSYWSSTLCTASKGGFHIEYV